MKIEKLYEASDKWDAFSHLSQHPELALDPIQIVRIKGVWYVVKVDRSNILDQTLYIVNSTISRYLWDPEGCPGHWHELRSLFDKDPHLSNFCHQVAREFDESYKLSGDSYLKALDEFLDQKIRDLR